GDPTLSQPEIDMLVSWVEGGAPEGDATFLPAPPPDFRFVAIPMPRYARSLAVAREATLSQASSLVAIRPKGLAEGSSLEAWATRPDGAVERLIWLTDYKKAWTHGYVLARPLKLPAGTALRVSATEGEAVFFFGR
ncbi:MAG: hypothetical protein ABUS49_02020, partial [Acidobacteriota bacterium]